MNLLIALDLDGTLAGLRRDPDSVRIPPPRLGLLRALEASGIKVLVVSGRTLGFLRRALSGTGAALAGEHGWIMRGVGRAWSHPQRARRGREARRFAGAARRAAALWPGCRVEVKNAAVAVHYRESPSASRAPDALRRALRRAAPAGWRLTGGKKVWEFRPADRWGKGDVIRLAARRLRARVVFAGDDATDEEAFASLGRSTRTIKVGSGPTKARERIRGPSEVDSLLRAILRSRAQSWGENRRNARP